MEGQGGAPLVGSIYRPTEIQQPDLKLSPGDVGILKSTLIPSFTLNSGFSIASFIVAKTTNRGELKDYVWPSSQVANAWWSAVGHQMYHHNIPFTSALGHLPYSNKVLLSCVTAWGTRLFYRIASRSISRGKDDPRYDELKEKDPGFWKSAFFKLFAPEAVLLTFISLPFTLPFRAEGAAVPVDSEIAKAIRAVGVGLFSVGFVMETLADSQLESHRQQRTDLCTSGVWSIVRHPNYLGDALVHFSFMLLNASTFNPLVLLGPLANYLYLRFVGGDKQNETYQEEQYKVNDPKKYAQLRSWRNEKNSFWPGLSEITNPWTWAVLGSGVVGVAVEEVLRRGFS